FGVAVATGPSTELGRLQAMMVAAETPVTPLEQQLAAVGNKLVLLGCGICGLVFGVGLLRGFAFLQMLHTAVSLAAAAVPEGLPTVATTTLALGVKKMEQHQVLIRRLAAVETLGCLQTICMDKTGTITKNEMTVTALLAGKRRFSVSQGDLDEFATIIAASAEHEVPWLLKAATLCNETEIHKQDGQLILQGSATEKALVQLAIDYGLNIEDLQAQYPLQRITHRSEQRPFMASHHRFGNGQVLLALKGSPLEVLAMCDWYMQDGQRLPLTAADRLAIETENDRMAGDALRVLGVAFAVNGDGELDNNHVGISERGYTWLGLLGLADPIREGVRQMIRDFHRAGIHTIMITGDQSATAYAIAKELNLSKGRPLEILDSTHLESLDRDTIKVLAQRVHIFARVSPAHKLEIVQALQSAGRVVGMTGDGINDGPALKAAEVGIAMGESGTDIAREVADVVLKKDNMGDLIIAIQDGRTTYSNIKKAVHFFLSTNVSEIAVMFTALAAGLGSPLSTMQLLWINLVSDIFPGLALTQEAPEPDVLDRPPRPAGEPIFTTREYWRMAQEGATLTAATLGAYGYGLLRYGLGPRSGTLAFHTLTISQLLHAFSCRSERHSIFANTLPRNPLLHLAVFGSIVLQVMAQLLPGLRSILGMAPISLIDGAVIAGTSLLSFLVNELTKLVADPRPVAAAELEAADCCA
ncbi:MAG: cation-translocating P-type ATPase, partial [Desulfobacca sp.]|uniref:cation-translocating P-type ATPase n=1 Tax=Desulfobacca sp. TaxID=2067990 RepID=UPI00404907C4